MEKVFTGRLSQIMKDMKSGLWMEQKSEKILAETEQETYNVQYFSWRTSINIVEFVTESGLACGQMVILL